MADTGIHLRVIGGAAGVLDAVRFGDRGYLPFFHLGDWNEAGIVALHEEGIAAVGSAGHDRILITGAGAPHAGAGDDRYEWVAGITGTLRLSDVTGNNRLELPWTGALTPLLDGSQIVLADPAGGARVELTGFDPSALRSGPRPVSEVHLADGLIQTWDQLVDAVNARPRCTGALPVFEVLGGTGRTLTLPTGLLSDPDLDDTLTLSLVSPAPTWVRVAPETGSLIATPAANAADLYTLTLRARDPHGDSVDFDVEIRVLPMARTAATAFADGLTGTAAANVLRGLGGADAIRGLGGADRLEGQLGNDYLRGDAGMDVLVGGVGDDWLDGGAGADRLLGGTGNDNYFFGPGSGRDTVVERANEGVDCIRLGSRVTPEQLLLGREAGGWVLGLSQTSDRLLLGGALDAPLPVEILRFADGTRYALSDAANAVTTLAGDSALLGGASLPLTPLASLLHAMDDTAPFMGGAEIRAV
jgi:Ca2+-binding RTX toxin-like protein